MQLETAALELYDRITHDDKISINMAASPEIQTLSEFLEGWRMKLWDYAFTGVFKGTDAFKKSDSFMDFSGSILVVWRLIFRYVALQLSWIVFQLHCNLFFLNSFSIVL